MAPRASWSGVLRVGGAEIPLKMYPAVSEEKVELKMTCPTHGSRIHELCLCDEEVEGGEAVFVDHHTFIGHMVDQGKTDRAYDANGILIPVTKEERDSLLTNEDQVIEIVETRSSYGFDPAYIAQTYRAWTDESHEQIVGSLCRALDKRMLVGIGRIVANKRVTLCALRSDGHKGLIVMKLNWPSEIRPLVRVTEERADPRQVSAFEAALAAIEVSALSPIAPGIENTYVKRLMVFIKATAERLGMEQLTASIG